MKKLGLFFIGLLMCSLSLTSCLEGGNVIQGDEVGVLGYNKNLALVMKTPWGDISSPALNNPDLMLGECYYFLYSLDYELPENASNMVEANGYYTVSILDWVELPKYYLTPYLTDTATLYGNEIAIKDGFYNSSYVSGYLFISQSVTQRSDADLRWDLSYDYATMQPTVEDGRRYYDLYVRATVVKEGTKSETDIGYINAYYMDSYLSDVAAMEKSYLGSSYNENSSVFYLRVHYVTGIDKETQELKWESKTNGIAIYHLLP
jgi:hypothetical protein